MRTTVTTDTATIVLFDPECMRHRLNEDADWWSLPQEELLEVNRANAAFMNVSADGRYELEVAAHKELGDADVELVVRNTSGRFFFGAGEMMSSAGLEPEAEYGNVFLDAVPGSYLVRARQRGGTVTVSLTPTTLDASNSFGDLVRLGA
ncbi:DUF6386 family protein [Variovorax sp. R-27]|uniref:DUF6386 family protein n=1 Tax=Variovorax sp. R-27 TaxID=3404058 RepID=UPI003CFAD021